MARVTVRTVRPAPQGFRAAVVALASVTIAIGPDDEPIELYRWQPGKDGHEGKEWKTGSIPEGVLRFDDVPITKHNDRHFAQPNTFKFPREISDAICDQALRLLKAGGKPDASADAPPPRGQYDAAGDPFEAGASVAAGKPH